MLHIKRCRKPNCKLRRTSRKDSRRDRLRVRSRLRPIKHSSRVFSQHQPTPRRNSDRWRCVFGFPHHRTDDTFAGRDFDCGGVCAGQLPHHLHWRHRIFNPQTPLGTVLPALFQEAHFGRDMGVHKSGVGGSPVCAGAKRLGELPDSQRVFLFVNLSADASTNGIFHSGAKKESCETQTAALCHVDRHLPVLTAALKKRGGAVGIVCSDHGTCFGEAGDDGYVGHRIAHPNVLTVPYAEFEVSA